ncbi:MAG: sulfate ABC transporter permease subunit CysT, partial [Planctomycetaceae bacterium]
MAYSLKQRSILPGFGLTMGYSILYLSLIVLIPLMAMFLSAASMKWGDFWGTVTSARVLASYKLSLGASLSAAAINAVFGLMVAWSLVRYDFPCRRIVDAMIDLPFALPTAVAGIALTTICAPTGWMGRLLEPLGVKVAFTP